MAQDTSKPLVEITDWSIQGLPENQYLLGIPINHPNHLPGHRVSNTTVIQTSPIISIDYEKQIVETRNTRYHLQGERLASAYAKR